jgi:hypothetical protein
MRLGREGRNRCVSGPRAWRRAVSKQGIAVLCLVQLLGRGGGANRRMAKLDPWKCSGILCSPKKSFLAHPGTGAVEAHVIRCRRPFRSFRVSPSGSWRGSRAYISRIRSRAAISRSRRPRRLERSRRNRSTGGGGGYRGRGKRAKICAHLGSMASLRASAVASG